MVELLGGHIKASVEGPVYPDQYAYAIPGCGAVSGPTVRHWLMRHLFQQPIQERCLLPMKASPLILLIITIIRGLFGVR